MSKVNDIWKCIDLVGVLPQLGRCVHEIFVYFNHTTDLSKVLHAAGSFHMSILRGRLNQILWIIVIWLSWRQTGCKCGCFVGILTAARKHTNQSVFELFNHEQSCFWSVQIWLLTIVNSKLKIWLNFHAMRPLFLLSRTLLTKHIHHRLGRPKFGSPLVFLCVLLFVF